jgi:2-keto-3-deoxy-L-rhamnonate aldolase RhmA
MPALRFQQTWRDTVRNFRAALAQGDVLPGVFVAYPERRLMDMYAIAGMSFIIIDMEHAPITMTEADAMCETAVNAGLAPLVRAATDDRQALLRCLDAGAAGIVIPDVRTAAEVRGWVDAISYPPTGMRGLAQVRANNWDSSTTTDDPQFRPLLVPMIESLEAIGNADELFAIKEVDWYHVGLVDLGMRLRGEPSGPKVVDLLRDLGRKAKASGKPLGANQIASPAVSPPVEGVQCVAAPDRALLLNGTRLFLRGQAA